MTTAHDHGKIASLASAELDGLNLTSYMSSDDSFATTYIRAIVAIASTDDFVSLAEFQALNEILTRSESNAVTGACFLQQIERPTPFKTALANLKNASLSVSQEVRLAAFDSTKELIQMQGVRGRPLAVEFAQSLNLPALTKFQLAEFDDSDDLNFMQRLRRSTVGRFGNKDVRDLASMCFSVSGDSVIEQKVRAFEAGSLKVEELNAYLGQSAKEALIQIEEFEKTLEMAVFAESTASAYLETAERLRKQVSQRLTLVGARIDFEREVFEDDIAAIVHDAGNAFELEVADRLQTDKAKKADVWESIGRSTFAKEIELRITKAVTRREEQLRLLKEDLRLFQEDMSITRSTILKQQHFAKYAPLMPKLRIATRFKNTVDATANTTLAVGATSAAGAGAAVYFLGVGAVLPVVAPVLPIFAGAMAVAGLIKLVSDQGARLRNEILHKRQAFEKVLYDKLKEAQSAFNAQLDEVAIQFKESAVLLIRPVILEAEASEKIAALQVRVARTLVNKSKSAIAKIAAAR